MMVFFNRFRKGQAALEFTMLIGFTLLMISVFIVVFRNNIVAMDEIRERSIVDQTFNLALSELEFADVSRAVYNRTFFLPHTLKGYNYNLNIHTDDDDDVYEVVLNYRGFEHVRFLINATNLTGDFGKGVNTLIKTRDGLFLNSPTEWFYLTMYYEFKDHVNQFDCVTEPVCEDGTIDVGEHLNVELNITEDLEEHYVFLGWEFEGDNAPHNSEEKVYSFTMTNDVNVTAVFGCNNDSVCPHNHVCDLTSYSCVFGDVGNPFITNNNLAPLEIGQGGQSTPYSHKFEAKNCGSSCTFDLLSVEENHYYKGWEPRIHTNTGDVHLPHGLSFSNGLLEQIHSSVPIPFSKCNYRKPIEYRLNINVTNSFGLSSIENINLELNCP